MGTALRAAGGLLFAALVFATGAAGQDVDWGGIGHVKGDPEAEILVVEFVDMGCTQCRAFHRQTVARLWAEFGETGRMRWRVVPYVSGQPNGEEGARAVECAAEQDAFWAMHDRLFEEQPEWFLKMRPQRQFFRFAEELGLDEDRFEACYRSERTAERTEANGRVAREAGVRATPTFLVNGRVVLGALPAGQFRTLLLAAAGS